MGELELETSAETGGTPLQVTLHLPVCFCLSSSVSVCCHLSLHVCLSLYMSFGYIYVYLSIRLSVCVYLFVSLSFHLFYMSILSVYQLCLFHYLYAYQTIHVNH